MLVSLYIKLSFFWTEDIWNMLFCVTGLVVKASRVDKLAKGVREVLGFGSKNLSKASNILNSILNPISIFRNLLSQLLVALETGMGVIQGFVQYTIDTLYCAYLSVDQKRLDLMNNWIYILLENVSKALKLMSKLVEIVSILYSFQNVF